jgi:hypothetical protein
MNVSIPSKHGLLRRLAKYFVIIALMVLIFPLGLVLMLRSTWPKKLKIIVTPFVLMWGVLLVWAIMYAPPTLRVDNLDPSGATEYVESSTYEVKGYVYPYSTKVIVNDREVTPGDDGTFSVSVPLPDTQTAISVKAIEGDKVATRSYTVTRPSDEEMDKKADEQDKLAAAEAQRTQKQEVEAKIRAEQEADQKQAEAAKQQVVQIADAQKKIDEQNRIEAAEAARSQEAEKIEAVRKSEAEKVEAARVAQAEVLKQEDARAALQKKADEQVKLAAAEASRARKPEITSVEKSSDGYVVKGYAPASRVIAVRINGSKRTTTKTSDEGTFQLQFDNTVTPYGYMELSLEQDGFWRKKYQDLQSKKYYTFLAELPLLSNDPMPAFITSAKKDGDAYTLQGYYLPKTKVAIKKYDETIKTAKTDKDGLFELSEVQLDNDIDVLSLYAQYKKGWFSHDEVAVSEHMYFNSQNLTFTVTPKPKHSFEVFNAWFMGELYDGQAINSAWKNITAYCGRKDREFGTVWISCMQEQHKDYLKPDTFMNDNWTGDYSTMVGNFNQAAYEKIAYGSMSETDQYKKNMHEAQTIYNRLAVTE